MTLMGTTPTSVSKLHYQQNEADYLEGAHQSDHEARRVSTAEVMLREIPCFT